MMEAVDRALAALLRRDVLGDAVEVSLEAPNRPWSQGVTKPTINLFLFDVRENLVRREVMVEPVRDASGAVIGAPAAADPLRPLLHPQLLGLRRSSSSTRSCPR